MEHNVPQVVTILPAGLSTWIVFHCSLVLALTVPRQTLPMQVGCHVQLIPTPSEDSVAVLVDVLGA